MQRVWRTRSVINLSSAWVNALDAISLWSSLPQFFESDSARVSEYSCTFGFRWARRLSIAAMTFRALGVAKEVVQLNERGHSEKPGRQRTHPCSPSSSTLSHKFRMVSQFSLVRVSSVAFTFIVGEHKVERRDTSLRGTYQRHRRKDSPVYS